MLMEAAKAWVGRYTWVIAAAVLLLTLLAIQAEGSIAAALDPLLPTTTDQQMTFGGDGPPAPISATILGLTGGRRGAEVPCRERVRARFAPFVWHPPRHAIVPI